MISVKRRRDFVNPKAAHIQASAQEFKRLQKVIGRHSRWKNLAGAGCIGRGKSVDVDADEARSWSQQPIVKMAHQKISQGQARGLPVIKGQDAHLSFSTPLQMLATIALRLHTNLRQINGIRISLEESEEGSATGKASIHRPHIQMRVEI